MKLWNKPLVYWLRVIHRDLGYLMVGISIVYAVSGMLLNHMDGKDPAFKTTEAEVSLNAGMDVQQLAVAWDARGNLPLLKKALPIDADHIRLMLEGGVGVYSTATGVAEYETHEKRPVVYWFNRLHYNRIHGWSVMGDFFALSLCFFAVSGLFMVKGKNGLSGRGKWLFIVGVLIPLLYVLLA